LNVDLSIEKNSAVEVKKKRNLKEENRTKKAKAHVDQF
jgi:hypothetical protein